MPTSTLILQHCIQAGRLPRLTPIPRRLSPTARAVGLVPFTPTALRRRDQIDHTHQHETGPEPDLKVTRSSGGPATGRCGGHAQVSGQAKHYAHRGINALMYCDKAFQDPCHSATRERKYVQQHIRICTHGVKTGLG